MSATKVTIVRVEEQSDMRAGKLILLASAFLFGIFIGIIAVFAKDGKIILPYISPLTQLGAIGGVESGTETLRAATATEASLLINPDVVTPRDEDQSVAIKATAKTAHDAEILDLTLRITDREITLVRLNQEIERTKNDSVALIAVFQQNCGSWTDDCAKKYSGTLESYNTRYTELISKITPLESELESLKSQLRILE